MISAAAAHVVLAVASSDHPRRVIQGAEEPWDGRGMVAPDYVRSAGRVAYVRDGRW
jgi:hypothetical protein